MFNKFTLPAAALLLSAGVALAQEVVEDSTDIVIDEVTVEEVETDLTEIQYQNQYKTQNRHQTQHQYGMESDHTGAGNGVGGAGGGGGAGAGHGRN